MKFLTNNAHWFLRIALASVFVFHGAMKFMNLEGTAQMLPISYLQVVLVAAAEVGGGLLVLLGGIGNDRRADLATRIGAALNLPVMIGAISIVHWVVGTSSRPNPTRWVASSFRPTSTCGTPSW